MKNSKFLKVLAIFLVVALAVSAGFLFQGKSLKAADEEAVQVEAPAAPEPVVEVQEIVVSDEVAAPVVDEAAEEGEPAAETEEAAEPVEGEDAEEVEDAEDAEEAEEEEEETVLNIQIFLENLSGDTVYYGSVIRLYSIVTGAQEGDVLVYQWQYEDEAGWHDIVGANSDSYIFTVDHNNAGYAWRLSVELAA